jgi:hypothetical protein
MNNTPAKPQKQIKTARSGRNGAPAAIEVAAPAVAALHRAKAKSGATSGVETVALIEKSPAQLLLDKLGGTANVNPTEPFPLGDTTLYIRRLTAGGFQQFIAWSSRDDGAQLNVAQVDTIDNYNAAMLFSCVADDALGDVNFFTYAEAVRWATDRREHIMQVVLALVGMCLEINPGLRAKAKAPTPDEAKKEAEAAAQLEKKE